MRSTPSGKASSRRSWAISTIFGNRQGERREKPLKGTLPFPRKNRSPRSGVGSGKSTAGGSRKAAERRAARPAERSVQRVWDTSQQAETAVSGNAGNRCFESLYIQRLCLQGSKLPSTVRFEQLILVVTNVVITTLAWFENQRVNVTR